MNFKWKNSGLFILGALFFSNIVSWLLVLDLNRPQFLEVIFFDVGQGDAIFVASPQRHQILIDGGPDSAVLTKLAKEMPFWDRTIDLVILTHPEKDHLGGLIEVLKRYKVENILWTGITRDTSEYREWVKLIGKEKAEIFIAKQGQKIICSKANLELCYFDILYPFDELSGESFENSNDTSVVARLVFNDNSFLFTGDISEAIERKLVSANSRLNSDVLKVSHHGSKYSTDDYFLESVLPKIAVVQVGKNSYGHPTKEVLERLEKFGIKVLRTDLDDDIKIITDGKDLKVEQKKRPVRHRTGPEH